MTWLIREADDFRVSNVVFLVIDPVGADVNIVGPFFIFLYCMSIGFPFHRPRENTQQLKAGAPTSRVLKASATTSRDRTDPSLLGPPYPPTSQAKHVSGPPPPLGQGPPTCLGGPKHLLMSLTGRALSIKQTRHAGQRFCWWPKGFWRN